jgi:hypothetical protein
VLVTSAVAGTVRLPQENGKVDLLTDANVRLDGFGRDVRAGYSVAAAGDVNGDGRSDVIVGAPFAGVPDGAGSAYVVFGREEPTTISLLALGDGGFRIRGLSPGDNAGTGVGGAGDINGDGRSDVVVGAPFWSDPKQGLLDVGAAWVVFGKSSATQVDLASLGSGFRIVGANGDRIGYAVAVAGDVNGDGLADVVLGTPVADRNGRPDSGSAYLVFGTNSTTPVNLAALGNRGFRIDGATQGDMAGVSVAGAGDVNGDGRADLVVGASRADSAGRNDAGSAYVVFGKGSTTTIDLASLNDRGFRIAGAAAADFAGAAVAGAGDVNRDGRWDVLVGAPRADSVGRPDAGSAYVVFGSRSTTTIDLAALGGRGFRILGASPDIRAGAAVSGAGDVNGDGRQDVVVGIPLADDNDRRDSGSAYVVFGKASTTPIDLARPFEGFLIEGAKREDEAGREVAAAGDFNGDRRFDVLVGAPEADSPNDVYASGKAYVVYGFRQAASKDRTAPTLALSAVSPQPVSSRGDVRLSARCNEACALRVTGSLDLGSGQSARLLGVQAPVTPAGFDTVLVLRPATGKKQIAAALAAGRRVRATLSIEAKDAAGNTTTRPATVIAR